MSTVRFLAGLSALAFVSVAVAQPTPAGLLPIDQAYDVSADTKVPGVVTVHFKIADGYYLYREQMKFKAGADTLLGTAKLPDGSKFHDEFAGDVETYHKAVDASVPYTAAPGGTMIHLTVGYQGCHETEPKLCYPPHTKSFDLPVNGSSEAASATSPTARPSTATGAQRYMGTPETREMVKAAHEKFKTGDMVGMIDLYKKVVEIDPNYAEAQFGYVVFQRSRNTLSGAFKPEHAKAAPAEKAKQEDEWREQDKVLEKQLIEQYTKLMAEHPKDAIYPWALGLVYNESDLGKQQSYCEKAVAIDPQFAQGYECLGLSANLRSTAEQALEFYRKAYALAPDDSEIVSLYAMALGDTGADHTSELNALLKRFPDSYAIAMTVVDQIDKIKPESARLVTLERLRTTGGSKPATDYAAEHLYSSYIANDWTKAKTLAQNMSGTGEKKNSQWAGRATYVTALLKAKNEVSAGKADAALATLKTIGAQKDLGTDKQWYLLQAQALTAAKRPADALNLLRESFVAAPSDSVRNAYYDDGTKAGQSTQRLDAALWSAFQAQTKPAKPFTLKRLDNGKPLSLSDYKGQVVMIDFWYPNCGPCRAAFPYIQQVAAKYKGKGLTVLAINGIEDQEPFAQPYLTQKKYDFIGLASNEKWARDNYEVQGFPTTFLVGADGKIYMKPTLYDAEHERSAELAVEELLKQAKS